MSNVLLILALAVWVYGSYQLDPVAGMFVLGAALLLLSLASKDVKIRVPRLKIRRRKARP